MDREIWKELPEDLREPVLARLPIETFSRFRTVCRRWNELPSSPSFTKLLLAAEKEQPHSPWFYTTIDENMWTVAVYDPSAKKWRRNMVPASATRNMCMPVASAGGLVCCINDARETLCVRNPIMRSLRELPAESVKFRYGHMYFGMTMPSGSSGGYKVLWVNGGGDYRVYDSTDSSWSLPQVTPSDVTVPLSLDYRSKAVCIDRTTLYFKRCRPDGLVSYDTIKGTWRELRVSLPADSGDHMLAECCGRIMLVGWLHKNEAGDVSCVCIWELQTTKKTMSWKEVDMMPKEWCSLRFRKVTCLGNTGLLMISLWSMEGAQELVTYDPLSREWLRVPDCAPTSLGWKVRVLCGTAFYPCLAATA